MKFDYVIGNPPYQISDGGAGVSATPIYNRFIEAIKTTHPGAICLIIPAKWYSGGKGLDKFREEMLGDRHISTLVDYSNSLDVFPNVDVAGGVCYFVWKEAYNGKCKYTNYRKADMKLQKIEWQKGSHKLFFMIFPSSKLSCCIQRKISNPSK